MPAMYEANLVGKRQEILDAVFNVEAAETPFLSSLKAGKKPLQMLASWIAEVYPAVASTGIIDGTPASSPARVDRYELQGCAQFFRREWGVTTLAEVTETAGVKDEAGHQMMAAMLLIKRMIEQQFLSADDAAAQDGATPWGCRGVLAWLQTAAQTNYPVNAALRPGSGVIHTGTVAALTETVFRTMLDAAYPVTKSPLTLDGHVGVDLKAHFDDWTNIFPVASTTSQPRTVYQGRDAKAYESQVDFLKFSTGLIRLQLNPYIAVTTSTGAATAYTPKSGVFLNSKMWDVGYLLKPANTNLAKDGSGTKGFIDAVALLRCLNPLGQLKVYSNS
jgi:hypothetical protein